MCSSDLFNYSAFIVKEKVNFQNKEKMKKVNILKNKLKTAKCNFTKSSTKVQDDLENFRKNKEKDAPKKRQMRLAEEALENLSVMGDKLKIVKQIGETLIEEIDDQGTNVDKPEEIVKLNNTELDAYEEKMVEFMEKNDDIILQAEATTSNVGDTAIQQVTTDRSEWRAFKPQSPLRPNFLEKESTHLETKHFCELFKSYIMDGFQGDTRGSSIHIHLQPLIEVTTDNKSLGQIVEIIMEESDARNPLHSRRIELLRVKKTGSHSDYLFNLEQVGDLIDMQSLTLDSLIMHLFLEQADQEMAKICQEILSKNPKGDLPMLRQEIKRTESSVWYNGTGNSKAKLAAGGRFCADCNSQTHDKKDC